MNTTTLIGAAFALYLALGLGATVVVLRSQYFDRTQKLLQCFLTWLIPFLGALTFLIFHSTVNRNMRLRSTDGNASDMSDRELISNVWHGHDR